MDDLISRQAVLDLISDFDLSLGQVIKGLHALPPVKPQEPKTGHWFVDERPESDREIICSNCEQPIFKYHKMDFDYRPKYCPNCGCRMVEPQEKTKASKTLLESVAEWDKVIEKNGYVN